MEIIEEKQTGVWTQIRLRGLKKEFLTRLPMDRKI
jgi:hypothetical protein